MPLIYNYLNFEVAMDISDVLWDAATKMQYENMYDFCYCH